MRSHPAAAVLRMSKSIVLVVGIALSSPVAVYAQQSQPLDQDQSASESDIEGGTMFATSCGVCHQSGGRAPAGARSSRGRHAITTFLAGADQEGQTRRHARLRRRLFRKPDHGDRGLYPGARGVRPAVRHVVIVSLLVWFGIADAARVHSRRSASAARSRSARTPTRCPSPAKRDAVPGFRWKSPENWRNGSKCRWSSNG